jgi:hypothetical protein
MKEKSKFSLTKLTVSSPESEKKLLLNYAEYSISSSLKSAVARSVDLFSRMHDGAILQQLQKAYTGCYRFQHLDKDEKRLTYSTPTGDTPLREPIQNGVKSLSLYGVSRVSVSREGEIRYDIDKLWIRESHDKTQEKFLMQP